MKKTLVILLILAVAGGVFAQEVTFSGNVQIGTEFNFDAKDSPMEGTGEWDDMNQGVVTLGYDNEGFHAELNFKGTYDKSAGDPAYKVGASASYDGDDYKINVGVDDVFGVISTLASLGGLGIGGYSPVNSLWGYWYFLDKQLKLDIAYKGYEDFAWRISDRIASGWDNMDGLGAIKITFAPAAVEGLSAGIFFPGADYDSGIAGYPWGGLLNDMFKNMVFGVKFEQDNFGAAAMVKLDANKTDLFSFNLTGKFDLSEAMSLGLELEFPYIGTEDDFFLAFSFNFDYHASPLTAGITIETADEVKSVTYVTFSSNDPAKSGDLHIKPYVAYEIIEDTFLARLDIDVGLYKMFSDADGVFGFEVAPALYFNPKADGISNDPAHALMFKYKLGFYDGDLSTNKFYMGYRWAF